MKLSDITELLSKAATAPQHAEIQEIIDRLEFFFKREDSEESDDIDDIEKSVFKPVYINFVIGEHTIKYPLLLLGTLTPVDTKIVKFSLETDLDLENDVDEDGNPQIQVSLKKGLFKNSSHLKIEGEFERGRQPEAFHQLQDKYNNLIAKALRHIDIELMEMEKDVDSEDKNKGE